MTRIFDIAADILQAAGPEIDTARDELTRAYLHSDPEVGGQVLEQQLPDLIVDVFGVTDAEAKGAVGMIPHRDPALRREAVLCLAAVCAVLKANDIAYA